MAGAEAISGAEARLAATIARNARFIVSPQLVVMLAIWVLKYSPNHIFPSPGPAVMSMTDLLLGAIEGNNVAWPAGVIRPISPVK
jgi:hypothetical protein